MTIKYLAWDGTEFNELWECQKYESDIILRDVCCLDEDQMFIPCVCANFYKVHYFICKNITAFNVLQSLMENNHISTEGLDCNHALDCYIWDSNNEVWINMDLICKKLKCYNNGDTSQIAWEG